MPFPEAQTERQKPLPFPRRRHPARASADLDKEIGSLSPDIQADMIALDGDPTRDTTAVRRVGVRDEGRSRVQGQAIVVPKNQDGKGHENRVVPAFSSRVATLVTSHGCISVPLIR